MLKSNVGTRGLLGGTRQKSLRQCSVSHIRRPVRQPRLGVSAFKDWFNGFVQPREPQQPQQGSQAAASEQPAAVLTAPAPPAAPAAAPKVAPKRDFLEARQVSLFQLFDSSDYKFDIPAYQRPYAWQTKQIYELLQDFVKAYQSRQEYFLGAIVATKAADGAHVPYQLIDGQQRLTSMVILLAFLHGWAREHGNEVLEGRIRRMLYLEADPLEPDSSGRYRLRLRDTDDAFFRTNILDSFLPATFRLAGVAAAAGAAPAAPASFLDVPEGPETPSEAVDPAAVDPAAVEPEATLGSPGAAAAPAPGTAALPLENETWWRLYENASFLRTQLDQLVAEGLNLQDFTFHVLRNCFVVLMVARDEGASFRIFSTLNGRGMDLSMVDKLKADLLAGELSPAERSHYADAWAEMESVLGRSAFHRVFDYMRDLAAVRDPRVGDASVLDYFTRKVDDPRAVKQILQVSLDYARLLLQLRQASWASPELAAMLSETPQDSAAVEEDPVASEVRAAVVAAAVQTLERPHVLGPEEEGKHLEALHAQHRMWQDGGAAEAAAEAVVPEAAAALSLGAEQEQLAAVLEVEAAVAPVVVEQQQEQEEDGGVLVFRFDEPAPAVSTTIIGTANATEAAAPEETAAPAASAHASLPLDAPTALTLAEDAPAAVLAAPIETAPAEAGLNAAFLSSSLDAPGETEEVAAPEASSAGVTPAAEVQEAVQEEAQVPAVEQLLAREELQQLVEAAAAALKEVEVAVEAPAAASAAAFSAAVSEAQEATQGATATASAIIEEEAQPFAAVTEVQEQEKDQQAKSLFVSERQRQAALLAELDARSRHLNMFADEAWLPPLLEFFYQTESLEHRVAFMKGAEALQLHLELQGDPAAKAARWGRVSEALLQRPLSPEAVLAMLSLTAEERVAFRSRLDSKDLYGTADQRTLRHLLVRCEPPSVVQQLSSVGSLMVEKIVPQSPPEGSLWRKTRITSPCDPLSAWPRTWYDAATTPSSTSTPSASSEATIVVNAASTAPSYEVKYWYEVQRLNWHGRLGNLVLLPTTAASAVVAAADYDAKAALWRQAGAASRLPGFTAPLVEERGRYCRFKFCYEECRQRHEDMLERLVAEFEL